MGSVTIRDLDGRDLAIAVLRDAPDGRRLCIDRVVAGKGRLLQHYFGKGLRAVLLDSETFRLRGQLSTRWLDAERRWFVELNPAAAPFDSNVDRDAASVARDLAQTALGRPLLQAYGVFGKRARMIRSTERMPES